MIRTYPSFPARRAYDADLRTELNAIGWQGRLAACADEHDVVQTVKDFLARWSPEEIATLPVECRPGRIVDGNDVAAYALQLARAQCDSGGEAMVKLGAFMTDASLRLAQVAVPHDAVSE